MKIKVCGMREASNIADLGQTPIDYIGFIFYSKSPRYVDSLPQVMIPSHIKRVGVFVNSSIEEIEAKVTAFGLDYIQLHGNESPTFCKTLKGKGLQIIKAFRVGDDFDFNILTEYEDVCDYFLLDAKGKSYGGNGVVFDWQLLTNYTSPKPFFLSGGIDLESISAIQELKVAQLYAIDINSKFEISPALKDIQKVQQFIQAVQETAIQKTSTT